jgi:hypothetical protein
MTVTVKLEIEIDGKLDPVRVNDILVKEGVLCQTVISEDVDGTKDWAILINRAEIIKEG